MKHDRMERIQVYICFVIMLVSLIPIVYLGRYNHPTGDDYYYGAETHIVWEETGSFAKTIQAACAGVVYQYNHWQGTYSAMLLMHLAPNVFGEEAYKIVTAMIIFLLSGGIFYLFRQLIKILNGSFHLWIFISSILTLLCIQTVPSQGETFFWYNGSMYYTGYFAVTLFFLGILCKFVRSLKYRYIPILAVLAFFLGGGNYVSLLPCLLIMICAAAIYIKKRDGKRAGMIGVIALVLMSGLVISAIAPGNQMRQADMWKIPAWKAIMKSLLQGLNYIGAWMGIWWLLAAVILLPFLWKSYKHIHMKFRYPVLVVGLLYGIFCSMSCPTFYTMNSTGPARAVSIVYYGFILLSFGAYYYVLGYIHGIFEKRINEKRIKEKNLKAQKAVLIGVPLLLLVVQIYAGEVNKVTGVKAVKLLVSGEAAAYEGEYRQRMVILQDASRKDAVLTPYVNQPDMLYVGDLAGEAQEATNQKVAQYFRKETVYVNYE